MARAKKEAALTPEERLQAALVPDWEWPYKLPENWCWTYQKAVCSLSTGEKRIGNDYPYWEVKCLRGITLPQIVSSGNFVPVFSKVILVDGENSGEVFTILTSGYMGSTFRMLQISAVVFPKYLELFILSNKDVYRNRKTGSAIPHLNKELFFSTPFPLPPLAEQQRIVDRIESLFAKLDEAKEKAQAVLDSFETRKAAILHKAFTGELTAKWREEHGVSIDNWKTTRFDSVAAIRSNLVDPAEYQSFPHIAPDNIEKKTGVLLEYHTIAEDGVTSGKHRFYSGQILYSKIRPYLSKAVVVDFDGLCSADMYPIEAYQNARCLWYYMLSDEFLLQASTAGSRSVLPKINQKELSALTVHLPTNDREQEEIARILDELFDKEQQTKEAAEVVLDQIDLMKRSILARAFRGELGTNDPSEESAVELLKRTIL